jgi:hypothetical protein
MGDFEMALLFYYRGNKSRPEMMEFRLGIQKASEAIENSIGSMRNLTIDYKEYRFKAPPGARLVAKSNLSPESENHTKGLSKEWVVPKNTNVGTTLAKDKPDRNEIPGHSRLLGELCEDKEYLQNLYKDKKYSDASNPQLRSIIAQALDYLDNRSEFWLQQRPHFSRRKEKGTVVSIPARPKPKPAEKKERKSKEEKSTTAVQAESTIGKERPKKEIKNPMYLFNNKVSKTLGS